MKGTESVSYNDTHKQYQQQQQQPQQHQRQQQQQQADLVSMVYRQYQAFFLLSTCIVPEFKNRSFLKTRFWRILMRTALRGSKWYGWDNDKRTLTSLRETILIDKE